MVGKVQICSFLLLVLMMPIALAFRSATEDGGNINEQITREALSGTVSDANLDFILTVVGEKGEMEGKAENKSHQSFSNGNFSLALSYIDREKKRALNFAGEAETNPSSRSQALRHFALALKACQDFYNNSNYVEIEWEALNKHRDPYNIELVDWTKVPHGYQGKATGQPLICGATNKNDHASPEGKRSTEKATYHKVAKELALRETQRQWNLFEALIRARFPSRAQGIIAALKEASLSPQCSPESLIEGSGD